MSVRPIQTTQLNIKMKYKMNFLYENRRYHTRINPVRPGSFDTIILFNIFTHIYLVFCSCFIEKNALVSFFMFWRHFWMWDSKRSKLKIKFRPYSNSCWILTDLNYDQCFMQNLSYRGQNEVILVELES
jgi:hypothetical protein